MHTGSKVDPCRTGADRDGFQSVAKGLEAGRNNPKFERNDPESGRSDSESGRNDPESAETNFDAERADSASVETELDTATADSQHGSTAAVPLAPPSDGFQLLHVEDDPDFAALTETYLSRLLADVNVETATSIADATDQYTSTAYDTIVCDYDLPDGNGIDFLEHVRAHEETIPFILFTGKGSEEIASEAISAGVTDYLQKRGGIEQFEVLANRLRNAVNRSRLSKQVDRAVAALRAASEPIGILAADGTYLFANEAYAAVYGLTPDDLIGNHWEPLYSDSERARFTDEILPSVLTDGHWSGEATGQRVDGTLIREQLALTHTKDGGHVCIIRDAETVTESPDTDVDG